MYMVCKGKKDIVFIITRYPSICTMDLTIPNLLLKNSLVYKGLRNAFRS